MYVYVYVYVYIFLRIKKQTLNKSFQKELGPNSEGDNEAQHMTSLPLEHMKEILQKPTVQKLSCVGLHIQRYSPTKEGDGICKAPASVS